MVRPIKILLLNDFGWDLFEYSVGHSYIVIILLFPEGKSISEGIL